MWTCFLRQADNLETMMGGDTQHTIFRRIKLTLTRLEKQKCCVEQHLFRAKRSLSLVWDPGPEPECWEWRGPGQGEGLVPSCRSALNISCPAPGWLQGDGHPATAHHQHLQTTQPQQICRGSISNMVNLQSVTAKFEDGMRMVLSLTSLLSTNNNAFVCHNYYVDDLTIPLIVLLILFNNVKMYCIYNISGIFQFLNKWLKFLSNS